MSEVEDSNPDDNHTPQQVEELGSIADGTDIPDSEEEIDQSENPIDPEEADESSEDAEEDA